MTINYKHIKKVRIPSMTISSSADHDDIMRKSILDVYSMIDESALKRNVATIGDAIISTVYQSKVSFLSLLH